MYRYIYLYICIIQYVERELQVCKEDLEEARKADQDAFVQVYLTICIIY